MGKKKEHVEMKADETQAMSMENQTIDEKLKNETPSQHPLPTENDVDTTLLLDMSYLKGEIIQKIKNEIRKNTKLSIESFTDDDLEKGLVIKLPGSESKKEIQKTNDSIQQAVNIYLDQSIGNTVGGLNPNIYILANPNLAIKAPEDKSHKLVALFKGFAPHARDANLKRYRTPIKHVVVFNSDITKPSYDPNISIGLFNSNEPSSGTLEISPHKGVHVVYATIITQDDEKAIVDCSALKYYFKYMWVTIDPKYNQDDFFINGKRPVIKNDNIILQVPYGPFAEKENSSFARNNFATKSVTDLINETYTKLIKQNNKKGTSLPRHDVISYKEAMTIKSLLSEKN